MRRQVVLFGMSLALFACVAHEKNGDGFAALGEWREAYGSYREALIREPDSPALKEKYNRAKREASADAHRKAQACLSRESWRCAVNEIDFALTLDPTNIEFSELRRTAVRSLAMTLVAQARNQAQQRQFTEALNSLESALSTANLPEVEAGATEVRREVGTQAMAEAEGLRSTNQFAQALSLMDVAVRASAEHAAAREAVRAQYEAFRTAEHDRLTTEGDAELAQRRWREAAAKYRGALAAKPGGRAEALAQFAEGLAQGESGIAERNFELAASGFRKAMASGLDREQLGQHGLDSVEVRQYRIRIRELMVSPAQPDGRPWVGQRPPLFDRLVKRAVTAAAGYYTMGLGAPLANAIVGEMQSLPPANVPNVHIEVIPPSGPKLSTLPEKKLYLVMESAFVVMSNHFDQRKVSFRIIGQGDTLENVGVFDLPLGDVIRGGGFAGASQSVLGMKLVVDAAPEMRAGYFSAMQPMPDPTNTLNAFSEPRPGTAAFRLTKVAGSVAVGDYQNDLGMDGPPDLMIGIEQGGRTIFQTPTAQDQSSAEWSPENVYLYMTRGETLVVRLWDIDVQQHDSVIFSEFTAEALSRGEVVIRTQRGSWVRLNAERLIQ